MYSTLGASAAAAGQPLDSAAPAGTPGLTVSPPPRGSPTDFAATSLPSSPDPLVIPTHVVLTAFVLANKGSTTALKSHISMYPALLRKGDVHHRTLLHAACATAHVSVVSLLLERGAQADARDSRWFTPMHYAAAVGSRAVVAVLLGHSRDVDHSPKDRMGRTPLTLAAANGHVAVVRFLTENYRVRLNARDRFGNTALHWAAANGHVECVRLLVRSGVDPHLPAYNNMTATQLARSRGHTDVHACLSRLEQVSRQLMGTLKGKQWDEAGMDHLLDTELVLIRDRDGKSALHVAADKGHVDAALALLRRGFHVTLRDKYQRLPIHWAALRGHVPMVRALLQAEREAHYRKWSSDRRQRRQELQSHRQQQQQEQQLPDTASVSSARTSDTADTPPPPFLSEQLHAVSLSRRTPVDIAQSMGFHQLAHAMVVDTDETWAEAMAWFEAMQRRRREQADARRARLGAEAREFADGPEATPSYATPLASELEQQAQQAQQGQQPQPPPQQQQPQQEQLPQLPQLPQQLEQDPPAGWLPPDDPQQEQQRPELVSMSSLGPPPTALDSADSSTFTAPSRGAGTDAGARVAHAVSSDAGTSVAASLLTGTELAEDAALPPSLQPVLAEVASSMLPGAAAAAAAAAPAAPAAAAANATGGGGGGGAVDSGLPTGTPGLLVPAAAAVAWPEAGSLSSALFPPELPPRRPDEAPAVVMGETVSIEGVQGMQAFPSALVFPDSATAREGGHELGGAASAEPLAVAGALSPAVGGAEHHAEMAAAYHAVLAHHQQLHAQLASPPHPDLALLAGYTEPAVRSSPQVLGSGSGPPSDATLFGAASLLPPPPQQQQQQHATYAEVLLGGLAGDGSRTLTPTGAGAAQVSPTALAVEAAAAAAAPALGRLGAEASADAPLPEGFAAGLGSDATAHEQQVATYLADLNLQHYTEALIAQGFDTLVRLVLAEKEDLVPLMKVGHLRQLLQHNARMRQQWRDDGLSVGGNSSDGAATAAGHGGPRGLTPTELRAPAVDPASPMPPLGQGRDPQSDDAASL